MRVRRDKLLLSALGARKVVLLIDLLQRDLREQGLEGV